MSHPGEEAEGAGEVEAADTLIMELPTGFLPLTEEEALSGSDSEQSCTKDFSPSTCPGLPLPLTQSSCDESSLVLCWKNQETEPFPGV